MRVQIGLPVPRYQGSKTQNRPTSHRPRRQSPGRRFWAQARNIRNGTSSLSAKPQTSFCKRNARAKLLHFGEDCGAGWRRSRLFPVAWIPATERFHLVERSLAPAYGPVDAVAPRDTESGGGICGWFCAALTPGQATDSEPCSPARRTGRQLHLPAAHAQLGQKSFLRVSPPRQP